MTPQVITWILNSTTVTEKPGRCNGKRSKRDINVRQRQSSRNFSDKGKEPSQGTWSQVESWSKPPLISPASQSQSYKCKELNSACKKQSPPETPEGIQSC